MDARAKYAGCLLGLALGDALGTTLEFSPPGSFEPITEIVGGGPFRLAPGQWTDDTSMALAMAHALVENDGEWKPIEVMEQFLAWFELGDHSCVGRCFDIGRTTVTALCRYQRQQDSAGELSPYCGDRDPQAAGNGSLMRLAPVPMLYARDPELAIRVAMLSSQLTHSAQTCVDACRYYAGLIIGALSGASKAEILSPRWAPTGVWEGLHDEIDEVAAGSFKARKPPQIRGTGYVVRSLEAALWAFHNSSSFVEGALLAVNLGDDADTTGAVYGQLAGAYYGVDGLPGAWLRKLAWRESIELRAYELFDLSESLTPVV